MRPFALTLALSACAVALAPSASAQGIDGDKLVELIEEATKGEPKRAQRAPRRKRARARPAPQANRRGKAAPRGPKAEAARKARVERQVANTLDRNQVSVNFDETPFTETLDFLRDVTGLNLVLSREAKEAFGEAPVTLRLKKVRLKSCLNLVLDQVSKDLKYGVRHGVLWIGTKEEWQRGRKMVVEVYDVSDLTRKRPNFKAPKIGLGPDGLEFD
jgi:hypothetical protein